jgi:predicted aspartyl protease
VRLPTSLCFSALFVLLAVDSPISAAPPAQVQVSTERSGVELAFRLLAGKIVQVSGRIGTQTQLRFAFDTGASMSVIDSKIADKLLLTRHPAESFNFDRTLNWQQARVPEVGFGPIRASNVTMLVGNLAEYSEFARDIDVIVGTDLLRLANFTIDYDTRKIVYNSFNEPASAVDPLSNCLFLEILVQGRPVRLIVDTGFPGILLFEERLLTSVSNLAIAKDRANVILGGRLRAQQTTLHGVVIGPKRRDISILLAKAPASDVLPGVIGVIGLSPLEAHRINFDFVERRLTWD